MALPYTSVLGGYVEVYTDTGFWMAWECLDAELMQSTGFE